MKTEYVTPPYSKEMVAVCKNLENKIDKAIKVQVDAGVSLKEAQNNTLKEITKHIHPEL